MPKGTRMPEAIKDNIRKDYYNRNLSVNGIAAKYGIDRRRIYDYVKSDRYGHSAIKNKKSMMYLSRDEIELVLLMLCECETILKGNNKVIAKCLEDKLLTMADEMTF